MAAEHWCTPCGVAMVEVPLAWGGSDWVCPNHKRGTCKAPR